MTRIKTATKALRHEEFRFWLDTDPFDGFHKLTAGKPAQLTAGEIRTG